MEITVHVPELAKALQRVQGIVEKKSGMPALANALIETKGKDAITVSATDLEIGLTADYGAEVRRPGAITLKARALYDIVRSLPEREVHLEQKANQWVEITCGRVKYRVVGDSPDGFPSLPRFDEVDMVAIEPATFRDMIEKTLYAVSTDETRYNLTGVYCEAMTEGPGLRMVSTDGHRLSIVARPMEKTPLGDEGVIIPRKGLIEVKKLLEGENEPAAIGYAESSAVFQRGNVTLTMRLVDGRFPDYQQVIPGSHNREVVLARAALQGALKRTSLVAPDKAQGVKIEVEPGRLLLSANNPDLGEAREEIEAQFDGEPLVIGFNFRYLLDVLSVLEDEHVVLELSDDLSPGVMYGKGSEGYKAVIMPMRI
jgi:DNA polymerase-3 subunit beta